MKTWPLAALFVVASATANAQSPQTSDGRQEADLPPGHPTGGGNGSSRPGEPKAELEPDQVTASATAPAGTIEVEIVDASGAPIKNTQVTLGILYNSQAKGDSRKRISATTDEVGMARFTSLDTGSGVAYRPMVLKDGATFSAAPFGLGAERGMRARLHVYPVTSHIEDTLIITQLMAYAEIKDDRIQIQQVIQLYNFGKNAWVPQNFNISLPSNFTAFATQQGMTDAAVESVPGEGIRLRGTYGPGEHSIEFKWQLPYSGDPEIRFALGTPPRMAAAQLAVPASKGLGLAVEGFQGTKGTTDASGQRLLVSQRQFRREEPPPQALSVSLTGLPTEGPGRGIATLLAMAGVIVGIVVGMRKTVPTDARQERDWLLAELDALERAHESAEMGPKTYERERRELLDSLARTLASLDATEKKEPNPPSSPRASQKRT